jgi:hypothetical protein
MQKSCTSTLLLIQNNGRYSDKVWVLTASYTRNSDGTTGYSAQPNNDLGIITPTAALSSFPFHQLNH